MSNNLFIKGFRLNRADVESFDEYPFDIPVIKSLTEVEFGKTVTFLVGENGAGKSTIIEALAVCMGLSAEGGTRNMVYETRNSTSRLHEYLTVYKSGIKPKWKLFLRAESFYTMASEFESYGGERLHEMSHGEAFLEMFDGFGESGLYLMDEPESALSPKNLMRLLTIIDSHSKRGSQFIISTHSPILLSYYGGEILNVDDGLRPIEFEATDIYQIYKRFLDCPERMNAYLFGELAEE